MLLPASITTRQTAAAAGIPSVTWALSRYLRLDVKGPLTGISGEGSGHSFPFRHSVEAMEMDLKCGAF